jgi:predicted metalloprotease
MRRLLLLTVALGIVTACAAVDPGVTATRSRQLEGGLIDEGPEDTGGGPETTLPVLEGVIDFGSAKPASDESLERDAFLTAAVVDIVAFNEEFFPTVYGFAFESLAGGIFAAYPERPDSDPMPGCGVDVTTYADVEGNGFYCALGDFIVYDDLLLERLANDLTLAGIGIVMAHEFGHATQFRIDEFDQPTILMEQQADCFAGAWTARVARGESPTLQFNDNDIKAGLIAMIEVRDPVELSGANDPNAHGSGFDRVSAFQEGFISGPAACEPFFREPRNLDDTPFDPEDGNAGNLPFVDPAGEDILSLIPADLDRFWDGVAQAAGTTFTSPTIVRFQDDGEVASCADLDRDTIVNNVILCPSTNELLISDDLALQLAGDPLTGDMSVGYLIAQGYSEAFQQQTGSTLSGEERVLVNDCLTGVWVSDIVPPLEEDRTLFLSAGDLDEVVIIAIVRGDEANDTDLRGTAFEKIAAFRTGFEGGLDACQAG